MAELPASSLPATQPWQFNEYKEAVERPQDLERALVALEIAATLPAGHGETQQYLELGWENTMSIVRREQYFSTELASMAARCLGQVARVAVAWIEQGGICWGAATLQALDLLKRTWTLSVPHSHLQGSLLSGYEAVPGHLKQLQQSRLLPVLSTVLKALPSCPSPADAKQGLKAVCSTVESLVDNRGAQSLPQQALGAQVEELTQSVADAATLLARERLRLYSWQDVVSCVTSTQPLLILTRSYFRATEMVSAFQVSWAAQCMATTQLSLRLQAVASLTSVALSAEGVKASQPTDAHDLHWLTVPRFVDLLRSHGVLHMLFHGNLQAELVNRFLGALGVLSRSGHLTRDELWTVWSSGLTAHGSDEDAVLRALDSVVQQDASKHSVTWLLAFVQQVFLDGQISGAAGSAAGSEAQAQRPVSGKSDTALVSTAQAPSPLLSRSGSLQPFVKETLKICATESAAQGLRSTATAATLAWRLFLAADVAGGGTAFEPAEESLSQQEALLLLVSLRGQGLSHTLSFGGSACSGSGHVDLLKTALRTTQSLVHMFDECIDSAAEDAEEVLSSFCYTVIQAACRAMSRAATCPRAVATILALAVGLKRAAVPDSEAPAWFAHAALDANLPSRLLAQELPGEERCEAAFALRAAAACACSVGEVASHEWPGEPSTSCPPACCRLWLPKKLVAAVTAAVLPKADALGVWQLCLSSLLGSSAPLGGVLVGPRSTGSPTQANHGFDSTVSNQVLQEVFALQQSASPAGALALRVAFLWANLQSPASHTAVAAQRGTVIDGSTKRSREGQHDISPSSPAKRQRVSSIPSHPTDPTPTATPFLHLQFLTAAESGDTALIVGPSDLAHLPSCQLLMQVVEQLLMCTDAALPTVMNTLLVPLQTCSGLVLHAEGGTGSQLCSIALLLHRICAAAVSGSLPSKAELQSSLPPLTMLDSAALVNRVHDLISSAATAAGTLPAVGAFRSLLLLRRCLLYSRWHAERHATQGQVHTPGAWKRHGAQSAATGTKSTCSVIAGHASRPHLVLFHAQPVQVMVSLQGTTPGGTDLAAAVPESRRIVISSADTLFGVALRLLCAHGQLPIGSDALSWRFSKARLSRPALDPAGQLVAMPLNEVQLDGAVPVCLLGGGVSDRWRLRADGEAPPVRYVSRLDPAVACETHVPAVKVRLEEAALASLRESRVSAAPSTASPPKRARTDELHEPDQDVYLDEQQKSTLLGGEVMVSDTDSQGWNCCVAGRLSASSTPMLQLLAASASAPMEHELMRFAVDDDAAPALPARQFVLLGGFQANDGRSNLVDYLYTHHPLAYTSTGVCPHADHLPDPLLPAAGSSPLASPHWGRYGTSSAGKWDTSLMEATSRGRLSLQQASAILAARMLSTLLPTAHAAMEQGMHLAPTHWGELLSPQGQAAASGTPIWLSGGFPSIYMLQTMCSMLTPPVDHPAWRRSFGTPQQLRQAMLSGGHLEALLAAAAAGRGGTSCELKRAAVLRAVQATLTRPCITSQPNRLTQGSQGEEALDSTGDEAAHSVAAAEAAMAAMAAWPYTAGIPPTLMEHVQTILWSLALGDSSGNSSGGLLRLALAACKSGAGASRDTSQAMQGQTAEAAAELLRRLFSSTELTSDAASERQLQRAICWVMSPVVGAGSLPLADIGQGEACLQSLHSQAAFAWQSEISLRECIRCCIEQQLLISPTCRLQAARVAVHEFESIVSGMQPAAHADRVPAATIIHRRALSCVTLPLACVLGICELPIGTGGDVDEEADRPWLGLTQAQVLRGLLHSVPSVTDDEKSAAMSIAASAFSAAEALLRRSLDAARALVEVDPAPSDVQMLRRHPPTLPASLCSLCDTALFLMVECMCLHSFKPMDPGSLSELLGRCWGVVHLGRSPHFLPSVTGLEAASFVISRLATAELSAKNVSGAIQGLLARAPGVRRDRQQPVPRHVLQPIDASEAVAAQEMDVYVTCLKDCAEEATNAEYVEEGGSASDQVPYVGLVNQGATCYQNSLLQQLFMSPAMRVAVLSAPPPTHLAGHKWEGALRGLRDQLQLLFARLSEPDTVCLDPLQLVQAFAAEPSDFFRLDFPVFEQNDAAEFFGLLVDRLGTAFPADPSRVLAHTQAEASKGDSVSQPSPDVEQPAPPVPPLPPNLIDACLGGAFVNQLIGQEGSTFVSEREEAFSCLQVAVEGMEDLSQSLAGFCSGEVLSGDNAYKLDSGERISVLKRIVLHRLPAMLVVQLKRFRLNFETFTKEKVYDELTFPLSLNVWPYTRAGLAQAEGTEPPAATPARSGDSLATASEPAGVEPASKSDCAYELRGVLVHSGSALGGHYFSYIRERASDTRRRMGLNPFALQSHPDAGLPEGPHGAPAPEKPRWFCFNDESVTVMPDDSFFQTMCYGGTCMSRGRRVFRPTSAFMLFYDRIGGPDMLCPMLAAVKPFLPRAVTEPQQIDLDMPEALQRRVGAFVACSENIRVNLRRATASALCRFAVRLGSILEDHTSAMQKAACALQACLAQGDMHSASQEARLCVQHGLACGCLAPEDLPLLEGLWGSELRQREEVAQLTLPAVTAGQLARFLVQVCMAALATLPSDSLPPDLSAATAHGYFLEPLPPAFAQPGLVFALHRLIQRQAPPVSVQGGFPHTPQGTMSRLLAELGTFTANPTVCACAVEAVMPRQAQRPASLQPLVRLEDMDGTIPGVLCLLRPAIQGLATVGTARFALLQGPDGQAPLVPLVQLTSSPLAQSLLGSSLTAAALDASDGSSADDPLQIQVRPSPAASALVCPPEEGEVTDRQISLVPQLLSSLCCCAAALTSCMHRACALPSNVAVQNARAAAAVIAHAPALAPFMWASGAAHLALTGLWALRNQVGPSFRLHEREVPTARDAASASAALLSADSLARTRALTKAVLDAESRSFSPQQQHAPGGSGTVAVQLPLAMASHAAVTGLATDAQIVSPVCESPSPLFRATFPATASALAQLTLAMWDSLKPQPLPVDLLPVLTAACQAAFRTIDPPSDSLNSSGQAQVLQSVLGHHNAGDSAPSVQLQDLADFAEMKAAIWQSILQSAKEESTGGASWQPCRFVQGRLSPAAAAQFPQPCPVPQLSRVARRLEFAADRLPTSKATRLENLAEGLIHSLAVCISHLRPSEGFVWGDFTPLQQAQLSAALPGRADSSGGQGVQEAAAQAAAHIRARQALRSDQRDQALRALSELLSNPSSQLSPVDREGMLAATHAALQLPQLKSTPQTQERSTHVRGHERGEWRLQVPPRALAPFLNPTIVAGSQLGAAPSGVCDPKVRLAEALGRLAGKAVPNLVLAFATLMLPAEHAVAGTGGQQLQAATKAGLAALQAHAPSSMQWSMAETILGPAPRVGTSQSATTGVHPSSCRLDVECVVDARARWLQARRALQSRVSAEYRQAAVASAALESSTLAAAELHVVTSMLRLQEGDVHAAASELTAAAALQCNSGRSSESSPPQSLKLPASGGCAVRQPLLFQLAGLIDPPSTSEVASDALPGYADPTTLEQEILATINWHVASQECSWALHDTLDEWLPDLLACTPGVVPMWAPPAQPGKASNDGFMSELMHLESQLHQYGSNAARIACTTLMPAIVSLLSSRAASLLGSEQDPATPAYVTARSGQVCHIWALLLSVCDTSSAGAAWLEAQSSVLAHLLRHSFRELWHARRWAKALAYQHELVNNRTAAVKRLQLDLCGGSGVVSAKVRASSLKKCLRGLALERHRLHSKQALLGPTCAVAEYVWDRLQSLLPGTFHRCHGQVLRRHLLVQRAALDASHHACLTKSLRHAASFIVLRQGESALYPSPTLQQARAASSMLRGFMAHPEQSEAALLRLVRCRVYDTPEAAAAEVRDVKAQTEPLQASLRVLAARGEFIAAEAGMDFSRAMKQASGLLQEKLGIRGIFQHLTPLSAALSDNAEAFENCWKGQEQQAMLAPIWQLPLPQLLSCKSPATALETPVQDAALCDAMVGYVQGKGAETAQAPSSFSPAWGVHAVASETFASTWVVQAQGPPVGSWGALDAAHLRHAANGHVATAIGLLRADAATLALLQGPARGSGVHNTALQLGAEVEHPAHLPAAFKVCRDTEPGVASPEPVGLRRSDVVELLGKCCVGLCDPVMVATELGVLGAGGLWDVHADTDAFSPLLSWATLVAALSSTALGSCLDVESLLRCSSPEVSPGQSLSPEASSVTGGSKRTREEDTADAPRGDVMAASLSQLSAPVLGGSDGSRAEDQHSQSTMSTAIGTFSAGTGQQEESTAAETDSCPLKDCWVAILGLHARGIVDAGGRLSGSEPPDIDLQQLHVYGEECHFSSSFMDDLAPTQSTIDAAIRQYWPQVVAQLQES